MSESSESFSAASPAPSKRRRIFKRIFKVVAGVSVVALVAAGGYGGWLYYNAEKTLNNIERKSMLPEPLTASNTTSSPTPSESSSPIQEAEAKPLSYLLLGSDTRGAGDPGRSDSIMLATLSADRQSASLVSFPRDLYVNIPGHDKNKINAAYALGGPKLTVATIQELTGTKIDHVAIINFRGFTRLINTLGGVTIDNPHTGCDDSQNRCWKAGRITLDETEALRYVRWRHGLPNGDLDRAGNQQRVLKAVAAKMLSAQTLSNPSTLNALFGNLGQNFVLDDTLSTDEIISTALSLRMTSMNAVTTYTYPVKDFQNISGIGDVDLIDTAKSAKLNAAITSGNFSQVADLATKK